ncbi:unnamed protein product [Withania somnifera]
MSSDRNKEKAKTLAELSAEAVDSQTLMADTGTGPGPGLPDEEPRVSQDDQQIGVNGNVDNGDTTSWPVVVTGEAQKVADADGISLLVEAHGSLENVGHSGREGAGQGDEADKEPGHLVEGMNGEESVAADDEMVDAVPDNTDDEMADAVDVEIIEDKSRDTRNAKHAYKVGDFVWGKIKSHPWWPGRVYDASSASEFAMKYNQTGRLLVAYFGDGSFSWCPPLQLVPFVDNFGKMSKQSTSKSFLYAVEKALDEFSVLVEFNMTCQCISKERLAGLSWPSAVNAGIKKGVPVPEAETVRLLLSQYEPAEILKGLRRHALTISNSNIFEFDVLKSWLSAFCRDKCGRPLASYFEPLQVEGLEDKKKDQGNEANDFSIPIEVPIEGPSEEETPNSGSAKSPMTACDKIYQKRKQKSVAELMGENAKPKSKKPIEDSTPSSVELSEKKRKKSDEKAKAHTGSFRSADEKIGKRVSKKSGSTELAKIKKLSVSIPERDELGDQLDMNASPLSRERKRSKYLSPPYTTDPKWNAGKSSFKRELEIESQNISAITKMGERMTKAARLLLSSPDADHSNEAVKEKKAEQFDDVDKSSRIGKRSCTTFDTMGLNASVNEVLSQVQSTALNPLLLRNGSLEKARGFLSSFRNSVYFDGSNYKKYHNLKTGKKRKSLESENAVSHSDAKSPESVPLHANKRKTKLNKTSGPPSQGTVEDGRETSAVSLMVTFSAGFSLPSEDEIIRIYNKFGDLNENETKVLCGSNSVQIVYRRDSDAAQAFKESVKQSPFGAADVNFTLSYSSLNSEIPLSSLMARKRKSQVQLIKQKLKGMASMLEKCNGKITTEEKLELENAIKGLLEKVSTVTSTNP